MVNSSGLEGENAANNMLGRKSVFAAIVLLAGIISAGLFLLGERHPGREELRELGLFIYETPRGFDDFELTDQFGEPFTRQNLQGRWTLLFFGYTFCPDICPITMATIRQFDQLLQKADPATAAELQVAMISVDPGRDTAEKLAQYVGFFDEDYIGATGEFATLFNLARQLNVSFSYQQQEIGDYLVSHSGEIILINPAGEFHGFFRTSQEPARMLATFRAAIAAGQP